MLKGRLQVFGGEHAVRGAATGSISGYLVDAKSWDTKMEIRMF